MNLIQVCAFCRGCVPFDMNVILGTMKLLLDRNLASGYKSSSQIARVLTENWVEKEIFCPSCGKAVDKYEHNRPLADFYCPWCGEDYELKSKAGTIGRKIVDGDFETAVKRTNSMRWSPKTGQVVKVGFCS